MSVRVRPPHHSHATDLTAMSDATMMQVLQGIAAKQTVLEAKQSRIETMLAQLLGALADDAEEPQADLTLDGDDAGLARDPGQSLEPGDPT
jgi:hypothetical protein